MLGPIISFKNQDWNRVGPMLVWDGLLAAFPPLIIEFTMRWVSDPQGSGNVLRTDLFRMVEITTRTRRISQQGGKELEE